MKQFWKDAGIALTMGLIMPAVLLTAVISFRKIKTDPAATTEPIFITEPAAYIQNGLGQRSISVLAEDGTVIQLPLNEYLTCVVLAEMPVFFEEEALKAQSVVARTYAMRAATGTSKHEDAAVCMQPSCCQAYITADTYLQNGGKLEDIKKVRKIVDSTDGMVLTYEEDLIEATYFSCSGGVTEDAVAVWGTDVPYLRSVESPGEEGAKYYMDAVTFSAQDFASALGLGLYGDPSQWFSEVTYTDGGGVATIVIGGETFSGTELRKLLSLRSTAFTISTEGESITIHTRGYGHRVGMSQYGANAMAASGSTYQEILAHYYQGTELTVSSD